MRVCVRACLRACVRVRVRVRAGACVRACVGAYVWRVRGGLPLLIPLLFFCAVIGGLGADWLWRGRHR